VFETLFSFMLSINISNGTSQQEVKFVRVVLRVGICKKQAKKSVQVMQPLSGKYCFFLIYLVSISLYHIYLYA
jgi:hypothetical protein